MPVNYKFEALVTYVAKTSKGRSRDIEVLTLEIPFSTTLRIQ